MPEQPEYHQVEITCVCGGVVTVTEVANPDLFQQLLSGAHCILPPCDCGSCAVMLNRELLGDLESLSDWPRCPKCSGHIPLTPQQAADWLRGERFDIRCPSCHGGYLELHPGGVTRKHYVPPRQFPIISSLGPY